MTYSLSTRERRVSRLNRKGFTLIELIVVIAILAILAAIAVPAFTGQLNKAKASTNNANEKILYSAAQIAVAQNGSPTTQIRWVAGAGGSYTGASGTDSAPTAWSKADFIAEWPTNPYNSSATDASYSVSISTSGVVTVTKPANPS